MPHPQFPQPRGAGVSARLRRGAGLALLAPALAAAALAAAPAGAQAATVTGTISGSFTVPAGTHAAADVTVQLADRNGSAVTIAPADEKVTNTSPTTATYAITNVAPGQYYVYFSDTTAGDNVAPDYYGDGGLDNIAKAAVVTVPGTGGVQTLAPVTLAAGATVTGSVADANAAQETAQTVTAFPVDASSDPDPLLAASGVSATVTAGTYRISGLPASTYVLRYGATGTSFDLADAYVNGGTVGYDFGSATQYPVAAASTTTASWSVPAVGAVSGRVTDAGGNGLGGVHVIVYDAAGNVVLPTAGLSYTTSTGFDGGYTLPDLLPGSYQVGFQGLAGSNLAGAFYGGGALATATKITVSSGQTTANINALLGAGATVSGTVTAAQGGAPLGGMMVELVDAQGNVMADAFTNIDGSYTLADLPAGSWYLKFVGGRAYDGQYYATEYYLGRRGLGGSTAIKLTAGQALANVNEALLPQSTALTGLPRLSMGALWGLARNRVGLRFRLTAGAGAGYVQAFSIKLPKYIGWNRPALRHDIVIPRDKFTYAIKAGRLVISFPSGKKLVNFRIKPGGIRVGKGIQRLAQQRRIRSEAINVVVADTTGKLSTGSFIVRNPR